MKKFCIVKFSRFSWIREFFLTVDDSNMDERLEISWCLVYYQVSGEPGIPHCCRRSDIYPWSVDMHASLFTDHRCIILFFVCLIFAVGLDREIILTAKFSQSTVFSSNEKKIFGPSVCCLWYKTCLRISYCKQAWERG